MHEIKISDTKDYFIKDGKPFFYLADTVWMAFTHIPMDEWREYLDYRRMQGFNTLQISILPVLHDMTESILNVSPFEINADGTFNYHKINDEYFRRAQEMVELACQKGFVPALGLLWVNYVPGTWAAARTPGNQMPLDVVKPYTEYVVKLFSRFNPVYLVSGDTKWETGEIGDYYKAVLDAVKSVSPDALATMHMTGNTVDMPQFLEQSPMLDFYMYQSGHMYEEQDLPYLMAEKLYEKAIKRPVINGEPCYDGSGYGCRYGRFNEFNVRKAFWQSVLSGAKAGIAYGAHGIWGWHRKGLRFTGEPFSSMPYDWRTALRFKGAWDYTFGKAIFERYCMFDIIPVDKILNDSREIRMSASKDYRRIFIYAPYNVDVKVGLDLSKYGFDMINLSDRYFAKPEIEPGKKSSVIKMSDFNSDVLIIGEMLT